MGQIQRIVSAVAGLAAGGIGCTSARRLLSPSSGVPMWQEALKEQVLQNPLLETGASLAGVRCFREQRCPRAVMVGLGLCRNGIASAGVPVDVLGLLLPAEAVRRALSLPTLVVLVADQHAAESGVDASALVRQRDRLLGVLARLRACRLLPQMQVLLGTELDREADYRRTMEQVADEATPLDNAYVRRQLADTRYLNRMFGVLIKVGWTIGGSEHHQHFRDEVAFDRRYMAIFGADLPFVYCKAGRTLRDQQCKSSPYVTLEPQHRPLLATCEDLSAKLELARRCRVSDSTINGVKRHLNAILRVYIDVAEQQLSGTLDQRLRAMLARTLSGALQWRKQNSAA